MEVHVVKWKCSMSKVRNKENLNLDREMCNSYTKRGDVERNQRSEDNTVLELSGSNGICI